MVQYIYAYASRAAPTVETRNDFAILHTTQIVVVACERAHTHTHTRVVPSLILEVTSRSNVLRMKFNSIMSNKMPLLLSIYVILLFGILRFCFLQLYFNLMSISYISFILNTRSNKKHELLVIKYICVYLINGMNYFEYC